MKVTRDETLTKAYVMEQTDLRKIYSVFDGFTRSKYILIFCKDGLSREFQTLEEFLLFENSPAKKIESLVISAHSEDFKSLVRVRFTNYQTRNINILIEGDEKMVTSISETIEERLLDMKPWYSFVSKSGVMTIYFALLGFAMLLTLSFIRINSTTPPVERTFWQSIAIIISSTIVITTAMTLINFFKGIIFPMSAFVLGQEVRRYKNKENFRIAVIVGFLVSCLAGVVVTLLFQFK